MEILTLFPRRAARPGQGRIMIRTFQTRSGTVSKKIAVSLEGRAQGGVASVAATCKSRIVSIDKTRLEPYNDRPCRVRGVS